MKIELEIGNNTDQSVSPLGAGVHTPGITYISPDGTIKPLPEYMSKEYLEIPLNLRERLYTMLGTPKTDFTNGSAHF